MQTLSRTLSHNLPDDTATLAAGEAIGRVLSAQLAATLRLQVDLIGDLGAGKTTLVRGVLRGLGYSGRVKSPTYPLLETYQVGDVAVAHFDLYRLESPEAFTEAGFEDYFVGPGVRFVEWPDRALGATGRLLHADWRLSLTETPAGGRLMCIESASSAGDQVLAGLAL